ncbi:MAG: cation transporter, partial [Lachnospiraceae bacterium]|nr:cation transporter [Lachnospiraceae bacterium]
MKNEKYSITGMSCAACSSAIERVTRKMEGVKESNVNLTTGILTISYDESVVTPENIIAKVSKAGFQATLDVPKDKKLKKSEQEKQYKEIKRTKRKVIANITVALPLLYVSMGHMLPINIPLPMMFNMMENPFNFALLQLFLTLIILFNGRKFYVVGFKSLFKGNPNMDSLVALGTGSAFIYSLIMTFMIPTDHMAVHNLYYESAAIVVTLV